MQQHLACAFFCVVACASIADGSLVSSASAAKAKAWLQDHPVAQQDELAELKSQNPEAYAIVKALLTKRSLGLLDPKHPSASFAAPPPASAQRTVPSGAAAFAKFSSPTETSATENTQALLYPDAPSAPASRDWLSWKPQDSALNDEAMVQNVLGAVAELKGQNAPSKSLLSQRQNNAGSTSQSSGLESHEADFGADLSATSPVAASLHDSDAQPTTNDNSYLKGIDFGLKQAADVPAATTVPSKTSIDAIQGNSYLRGINLDSVEQPASVSLHAKDLVSEPEKDSDLSSFSWGDAGDSNPAVPTASARLVQQRQAVEKNAPAANALTAWLDGGAKMQATTAQKPVATDSKTSDTSSNPYTTGLW